GEESGERIELPLLREDGFTRSPPIASQKSSHHSVATAAMPDENPAGFQHPRKLADDAQIIHRMGEESERGEEIQDRVKSARPTRRHSSHVAPRVAQRMSGATAASDCQ